MQILFFIIILLAIVGIFAKKYNLYFICAAIGIGVLFFAVRHGSFYSPGTDNYGLEIPTKVIEQKTDERGLTSIVYVKGNSHSQDTLALDYLTPVQLDSVIHY